MAAPKNPRQPTFADPISKQAYATAKRDLARTREKIEKDRKSSAARALVLAKCRNPELTRQRVRQSGFVSGMLPRLKAVMASYGMQLPVVANPGDTPGGRTDFQTIWVTYDQRLIDTESDVLKLDDIRRLAGEARGVFYHELGHCRFTIPFMDLMGNDATNRFHGAWNILEDQRMESAVVEESVHIASYFTGMVLRVIAYEDELGDNYPLLAGRWYMAPSVTQESRRRFAKQYGEELTVKVEECVGRYMSATTLEEMRREVLRLDILLHSTNTDHTYDASSLHPYPEVGSVPNQKARMEAAATSIEDHTKVTEPGEGGGPGEGGATSNPHAFQDTVDSLLEDWAKDKSLTHDVAAVNDAIQTGGDLPYWPGVSVLTDETLKGRARAFSTEITDVFRIATADAAPAWANQQRGGNLDVIRYITREPGNLEVFRRYQDYGDPGNDLKVSILLDVSSSMYDSAEELGAAGWAIKSAGDELKIDTEVHLFNASPHALYFVADRPDFIPSITASGGTNPENLFKSVLTEKSDKLHHIVMIMTDGDWSGSKDLSEYQKDNRTIIFFKFEPEYSGSMENRLQREQGLKLNYNPDEAHLITDLFDIPRILENLLTQIGHA
jgi:hypothetical protein